MPGGQYRPVLEIPPLPDATILLVEVGSTAHGTGLPGGEDHDEMGVAVETPAQVLGLGERGMRSVMQRTQPEGSRSGPGDTDRTLHSLRRFIHLAASGNPSILMSFWAPVIYETIEGIELRASEKRSSAGTSFLATGGTCKLKHNGYWVFAAAATAFEVEELDQSWWPSTAMTPSTPCIAPAWGFKG